MSPTDRSHDPVQRRGSESLTEVVPGPRGEVGIRVLHVDDDPAFLDLASTFLERENDAIEIVTATDADSGFDRIEEGGIDCVVPDYDMPGTDGLAFLRRVRESYPDLPFVLYTGKGSEEIASEAISAGVTDYLQKGSGTEQYALLANRIENAVAQSRAMRQVKRGFRAIETAREGISLLDPDGHFIYVNPAYADIVGYDAEELIGEHWETLYPPEEADRVREEILPAVPVEGRWTGTNTYVREDGRRIEVDHALSYTDDGDMVCLIQKYE